MLNTAKQLVPSITPGGRPITRARAIADQILGVEFNRLEAQDAYYCSFGDCSLYLSLDDFSVTCEYSGYMPTDDQRLIMSVSGQPMDPEDAEEWDGFITMVSHEIADIIEKETAKRMH